MNKKANINSNVLCGKAPQWLFDAFLKEGVKLDEVGVCTALAEPVAHHIDMMAAKIDNTIVLTPETEYIKNFIKTDTITTLKHLCSDYPNDVLLNVAKVGKYLICNEKYTAPEVLNFARDFSKDLEVINVKQGYAKCSICIVSDTVIITEDESIYNACKNKLNVLLISKGHVILKGYDYGFLGGASALLNKKVYFFGNIRLHPDFSLIDDFLRKNGIQYVSLSESEQLIDIGGIISI